MDISASMRITARDAGGAVGNAGLYDTPTGPTGACVSEPVRVSASSAVGNTIRSADRQMHRFWAASACNKRPALKVHALRALGARDAYHQPVATDGWSGHGLPMKNP